MSVLLMAGQKLAIAVCGLHLTGQPLNSQLTALKSTLVRTCQSAPEYRCAGLLLAVPWLPPPWCRFRHCRRPADCERVWLPRQNHAGVTEQPWPSFTRRCRLYAFTDANGKTKPGMVALPPGSSGGAAVHLEVWEMPLENFGSFMVQV